MSDAAQAASKSGGGLMRLLMILLVLGAIGGGAGWYYLQHVARADAAIDESAAIKLADPIYWRFDPAFVVNLPDGAYMRYLKLDIALMTRDQVLPDALEKHAPLLRNQLLMLFSSADYQTLLTREGKQAVGDAALQEINAQLAAVGVPGDRVEALYFTSFVMQ